MKRKTVLSVKRKESIALGSVLIALSVFPLTGIAKADEITVSGNGSASANEVSTSSNQTTTVEQTNTSEATNTISVSSDTGNNTADNNTGGNTAVQSGDVSSNISVVNTANSNNAITGTCCVPSDATAAITGNGAGSANTVSVSNSTTTTVQNVNTATITNHIFGIANTGNNISDNNTGGNIAIRTGDISIAEYIKNGPLNTNQTTVTTNGNEGYMIKIAGNGADSINTASFKNQNTTSVETVNAANILNESLWILNTGYNSASNNTKGNVSILTGGISFLADIVNGPINSNTVDVKCDCERKPTAPEKPETPPASSQPSAPAPTTTTSSSPSSNTSSSNGVGGEVLAAAVGKILPATGNYAFLFLLIGNSLLFLLGVTLRLRSGRSPGILVIPSL